MTGTRPKAQVPAEITAMTAVGRLESILWEAQLRAFVTYSGGTPAVCLTEATLSGLAFLIGGRSYLVVSSEQLAERHTGGHARQFVQLRLAGGGVLVLLELLVEPGLQVGARQSAKAATSRAQIIPLRRLDSSGSR